MPGKMVWISYFTVKSAATVRHRQSGISASPVPLVTGSPAMPSYINYQFSDVVGPRLDKLAEYLLTSECSTLACCPQQQRHALGPLSV